jgi:hypothetical protein
MECTCSAMTLARAGPKTGRTIEAKLSVPEARADASTAGRRPLESRPCRARGELLRGALGQTGTGAFLELIVHTA